MHHFCVVLLDRDTNPDHFEAIIAERMAPYNEEIEVAPYEVPCSDYQVARMARYYKTDDLDELAAQMDDWNGCQGAVINGVLTQLRTRNPRAAWDWYEIGGRYETRIPGGWCQVQDLTPGFTCWAVLTPDGEMHEQIACSGGYDALFDRDPTPTQEEIAAFHERTQHEWSAKRSELLSSFPRHIAVAVDYHN